MKIKTLEHKDIKSLMGDQHSFYYIPEYQRPYTWDDKRIIDFWEDITKAYENKDDNYFLGSFILIQNPIKNDYEVVDGQQRLTTIMIFLAFLRDFFASNNEATLAGKIQNEFIEKDGKYRLYTRNEDRAAFEKTVLSGIGSLVNFEGSNMRREFINALKIFRDLNNDLGLNHATAVEYLKNVYDFMMNKVIIITVVTDDITSAYTIFETINYRGTDLKTEDLLKNYLLKKLNDEINKHNAEKPNAQKNFNEEQQSFLAIWRRLENAETNTVKLEDLLNYHRTALLGTNPKEDLFRELTKYIRDKNISPLGFMTDWEKSVSAYESLRSGTEYEKLSDKTKKILIELWNINHTHWIPVLISARRSGMTREDFQNLVFEMERMYALFWISGYNAVKVKNYSWRIIREYINTNRPFEDIKKQIEHLMRENKVYRRFIESIEGNCYGQSWCKYLLAKYEYSLLDDSIIKKIKFDGTVQIEHILPQTMTDTYWKDRFTEEEQKNLVSKLGNLTLLIGGSQEKHSSKNQTASNKPFHEKINVYKGEALKDGISAFQMTQDLFQYADWTPEVISERQSNIINKLKTVWQISDEDLKNEEIVIMPKIKREPVERLESDSLRGGTYLDKGGFTNDELKNLLKETLSRETPLTPRLKKFLHILLSENRTFNRDELREKLYQEGVGENEGQAGRYLSNISQFLTKKDNHHLRQIVEFETGGGVGELKNNYHIVDGYRQLVAEVLL